METVFNTRFCTAATASNDECCSTVGAESSAGVNRYVSVKFQHGSALRPCIHVWQHCGCSSFRYFGLCKRLGSRLHCDRKGTCGPQRWKAMPCDTAYLHTSFAQSLPMAARVLNRTAAPNPICSRSSRLLRVVCRAAPPKCFGNAAEIRYNFSLNPNKLQCLSELEFLVRKKLVIG